MPWTARLMKYGLGKLRYLGYAVRAAHRRLAAKRRRFLLLTWHDPRGLGTIRENVRALQRFSRHSFDLLNLHGLQLLGRPRIPGYVALQDYRGILIHCTLAYDPQTLEALDRAYGERLADLPGIKIVMKQDEQFCAGGIVRFLQRIKADLLLTCLAPENVRKVYPADALPDIKFLHARTGYVTPEMRSLSCPEAQRRPIDIGYRGSRQPFAFGRLCYEKRQIGEVFEGVCRARGSSAIYRPAGKTAFWAAIGWRFSAAARRRSGWNRAGASSISAARSPAAARPIFATIPRLISRPSTACSSPTMRGTSLMPRSRRGISRPPPAARCRSSTRAGTRTFSFPTGTTCR